MELTAQKRDKFGKKFAPLRAKQFIPAELYGHGVTNVHLSVPESDFRKALKEAGESVVINLVIDGERRPVLIHDVGEDLLKGVITHVDFYEVKMDEKIRLRVPLEFVNEPPVVREKGAILVKAMHEIEVEALPSDIPHSLTVDLISLKEVGDCVYVKDLTVPSGVKIVASGETVVVTATPPAAEEEVAAPAPAVESVVVEGEEKREKAAQKTEETKE